MYLKINFLLLLTLCALSAFAQSGSETKVPAFSMYGDNYFITGTALGSTPTVDNSDVKLRFGFKHSLIRKNMPFDTYLFFTYQQLSFWDFYKESAPFRETNYNPGLGLGKLIRKDGQTKGVLFLEIEHESNGRDEENSRSWNSVTLEGQWLLSPSWQLEAAAWAPFSVEEETTGDLLDYRGYFSVGTTWKMSPRWFMDAEVHPAFTDGIRGNVQVGLYFKYIRKENRYLYLQFFNGYAEDLIDFQANRTRLRVGIAFRHLFANFH
ncbi:MAG: phospholipase A [Bacteroidota bacterium]